MPIVSPLQLLQLVLAVEGALPESDVPDWAEPVYPALSKALFEGVSTAFPHSTLVDIQLTRTAKDEDCEALTVLSHKTIARALKSLRIRICTTAGLAVTFL